MTSLADPLRRTVLTALSASAMIPGFSRAQSRVQRAIVLVHGAWHGGWCWRRVEDRLRAAGHRVMSITLTGLGDRAHLAGPSVNLTTHVRDIADALEMEELVDVMLVAHSYGGVPAALAADQDQQRRIRQLVFLDALLPTDGQSLSVLSTPAVWAVRASAARATPSYGFAGPPAAAFGVTQPEDIAWVERHLRPQPLGSYEEPVQLHGALGAGRPVAFISCEAPPLTAINPFREQARREQGWTHLTLQAPHDCMITHPEETSELILSLV